MRSSFLHAWSVSGTSIGIRWRWRLFTYSQIKCIHCSVHAACLSVTMFVGSELIFHLEVACSSATSRTCLVYTYFFDGIDLSHTPTYQFHGVDAHANLTLLSMSFHHDGSLSLYNIDTPFAPTPGLASSDMLQYSSNLACNHTPCQIVVSSGIYSPSTQRIGFLPHVYPASHFIPWPTP